MVNKTTVNKQCPVNGRMPVERWYIKPNRFKKPVRFTITSASMSEASATVSTLAASMPETSAKLSNSVGSMPESFTHFMNFTHFTHFMNFTHFIHFTNK
ncbi:MAG: hypothetical protein LBJ63_08595 [Prevotellaceae bacterium]|jgi:hypothetical protein|nr:hypothetical protein [Prevotellaceae bacterium]